MENRFSLTIETSICGTAEHNKMPLILIVKSAHHSSWIAFLFAPRSNVYFYRSAGAFRFLKLLEIRQVADLFYLQTKHEIADLMSRQCFLDEF